MEVNTYTKTRFLDDIINDNLKLKFGFNTF